MELQEWLQKTKISKNIIICDYWILFNKDGQNYLFDTSKFSKVFNSFNPEDIEICDCGGLLTFKQKDGFLDWIVAKPNKETLHCDLVLDYDSFNSFINNQLKFKPKEYRKGQYIFCLIDELIPGLSREIQFNKNIDCFYVDSKIPEFLSCAVDLIKEKEWL